MQMGSYSYIVRVLYVEGGGRGSEERRAGMPHLRTFSFVHGRLASGQDSGHRWPATHSGSSVVRQSIQHGTAYCPSLTCSPEPEMQREEIRRKRASPGRGWGSRASHREGLGWFPQNQPALAQPAALCAPEMPSTGGSCPSPQGHLLEGAALMLFRLIPSLQPAPPATALGAPQGWHSVLPVRWPLGWGLLRPHPTSAPPPSRP